MKKHGILHPELSELIASMGHMDQVVLADAGLPIPEGVWRIDLALKAGIPSFPDTLSAILEDLEVQEAIVAEEMVSKSPEVYRQLCELLGDISVLQVPHEEFKERTYEARGIVRTGEFTPFANVILISGVVF